MATGGVSSGEVYGATSEMTELGSDSYKSTNGGQAPASSFSLGSEEGYEFKCTRCDGKNKLSEAKFYCSVCVEFYCSDCVQIHSEISVLRSHTILGEEAKDRWGERRHVGGPAGAECEDHVGQIVSMYCEMHDTLCCPVCVAMNHRHCEGMAYLPHISKGISESQSLKSLRNDLNDIRVFAEEYKSKGVSMKSNLNESTLCVIKQLQDHRNKVNDLLDALYGKTEREVHEISTQMREQIESDDAVCDDILNCVDERQTQITNTNGISEPELFVRMRTVQRNLKNIQTLIEKLKPSKVRDQVRLTVDDGIVRHIDNLSGLGQFETSSSDEANTRSQLHLHAQMKGQTQTMSLMQEQLQKIMSSSSVITSCEESSTVSEEADIQIRLNTDPPDCCVESMCQMEDGVIVVADSCNAKLKLLNNNYTIIHDVSLQTYPYDICCTGQHELAVGLYNSAVQFVTVNDGKLTLGKSFDKPHQCCSLAYGKGKLYISQYHGKKIFVYDYQSLERVKTVNSKSFCKIQHMLMSKNEDMLFVADRENGIVALNVDKDGHKAFIKLFSIPDVCYVGGMCLDASNQLLIADKERHAVCSSTDNDATEVIVSHAEGLDDPGVILFDVKQSKLLAFNGSRGQTIKVFKIE